MLLAFPGEGKPLVKLFDDAPIYILEMCSGENRFNKRFVDALFSALNHIRTNPQEHRALVTVGSDRFFSNGLDLSALASDPNLPPHDFMSTLFFPLLQQFLGLRMPTVAAINGHAFAGGMVLAMAHDYRIMRSDRGFLCMNEVLLPSPIPAGMFAILKDKIPDANTLRDITLTAKRFTAEEALKARLVDYIADNHVLLAKAKEVANALAKINTRSFPGIKQEMNKEAIAALNEKAPSDLFAMLGQAK